MGRFTKREKRAYERSNRVMTLGVVPSVAMVECVRGLRSCLAGEDREGVQACGQALLDLLCGATGAPPARLRLRDTAYAKFTRGRSGRRRAVWKLYGTCDDRGILTLAFRTAVRRQVFAFKTFLQTLIHELCHHVDYRKLKLAASFHTRGFYSRVDSLYRPLVELL